MSEIKPKLTCYGCDLLPRRAYQVALVVKVLMERQYTGSITLDFNRGALQIGRIRKLEVLDAGLPQEACHQVAEPSEAMV